jgi:hypothetical protein
VARPLKYKTVAELQKAIDEYFEDCKGEPLLDEDGTALTDKHGNPIILGAKPPTVTGLALALGFNSRQALLNYQVKKQFHDTITRAKSRCEAYAEGRLFDRDGSKGAQFSLAHNFGWGQIRTQQGEKQNNLLEAIRNTEEINTDDLPEVE